jgi:hypothetical protein
MAQALLETSAAVVEGLIKAFDDYEKKCEVQNYSAHHLTNSFA